ncbi:hypothetical protein DICPUDRAFT_84434 [Dictyostelium purpureum]|uniref:Uncharacterized protein n=1 Tax=Dictyostelium purpureum TaxID=5786 RepID=F1A2M4_DICPU|nr:uncharacterized protein DICPUDRAFT_84434 [Dictyostelium purpureum]EGC29548.1 hypothetical protein DICPUDRAFT_84434 [Dictyostelium purpureum]|eukprot:XP_003293918.1 hypothetical protein DICPUDRAFT_84434 [Dictyostelium purpureum]
MKSNSIRKQHHWTNITIHCIILNSSKKGLKSSKGFILNLSHTHQNAQYLILSHSTRFYLILILSCSVSTFYLKSLIIHWGYSLFFSIVFFQIIHMKHWGSFSIYINH